MSHNIKTSLILCAVILLSSIGGIVLIFILTKKNIDESKQISVKIKEETARSAQAKNLVLLIEKTKNTQKALNEYLVDDSNIVGVVEVIEKLGTKTGTQVTISSLDAEDSSTLPVGTINKIHARIEARGSWESIISFVYRIESLPFKSSISGISLRQGEMDEKTKKRSWIISFSIEILKIK